MSDLKCDAIPERTSENRKFKDWVSQLCYDQEDLQIRQERMKQDFEHIENKINHLTTMAEEEARRGLRKRKMEYLRKQKKPKEAHECQEIKKQEASW